MNFRLLTDDQIRDNDVDTLKRFVRYRLGGYRVAINDVPAGHLLFRGVRCPERPTTIGRISYPPPERVTCFGRANRPGVPMFYCSVGAPSALYEIRAQPGHCIALSAWELTEPLWMHHLGYHEGILSRMGVREIGLRHRLTNPIPGETKENARMRRLLSLAYTKDIRAGLEYQYKLSVAINELLFDGASPLPLYPDGPKLDQAAGTVYPAMRMKGAADNLAIWPSFVDSTLRLTSVRYMLVEATDETQSSYTTLTLAVAHEFNGRTIIWREASGNENSRRSRIEFENGEWILRDGWGNIYDRH